MTTTVARGSPLGTGGAATSSGSVSSSSPGGPLGTTPVPPVQAASSTSLPSPSSVAAPRPLRFCVTSPTTSKPSVLHRRSSSLSDERCSASVTPGSCTPTSTALGRGASVGDDMVVLRGLQDYVRRLPKGAPSCSRSPCTLRPPTRARRTTTSTSYITAGD